MIISMESVRHPGHWIEFDTFSEVENYLYLNGVLDLDGNLDLDILLVLKTKPSKETRIRRALREIDSIHLESI